MSGQTPIAELMARDPMKHTLQDTKAIVEELRKNRIQYIATDDKKVGTPAARKTETQKKREKAAAMLSPSAIDDLLSGI